MTLFRTKSKTYGFGKHNAELNELVKNCGKIMPNINELDTRRTSTFWIRKYFFKLNNSNNNVHENCLNAFIIHLKQVHWSIVVVATFCYPNMTSSERLVWDQLMPWVQREPKGKKLSRKFSRKQLHIQS